MYFYYTFYDSETNTTENVTIEPKVDTTTKSIGNNATTPTPHKQPRAPKSNGIQSPIILPMKVGSIILIIGLCIVAVVIVGCVGRQYYL